MQVLANYVTFLVDVIAGGILHSLHKRAEFSFGSLFDIKPTGTKKPRLISSEPVCLGLSGALHPMFDSGLVELAAEAVQRHVCD